MNEREEKMKEVKDGKITKQVFKDWEKETFQGLGKYSYESKIKTTVEDEEL